jgi:hypothetical protein
MWQSSYTGTTDLPVRTVWDALRKIHTGEAVSADGDTFERPSADQVGPELGPQISADFPGAMKSLFAVAAALAE